MDTRKVAASDHVHVTNVEDGSGRVMYVVSALEQRQVLGPLYQFMTLHPRGPDRELPPLFMRQCILPFHIFPRRSCQRKLHGHRELDDHGIPYKRSPWFRMEINQEQWPLTFSAAFWRLLQCSCAESNSVVATYHRRTQRTSWWCVCGRTAGVTGVALNKLMTTHCSPRTR